MIMVSYDRPPSHRPSHYSVQGRETGHLHHLDHHTVPSTPSPPYQYAPLPSFSTQHQQAPTSVRSTPTSYPSPASYPSPSMSTYSYQAQQGHQSPHYQPLHSSSISLPPIRTSPHLASVHPPINSSSQFGSPLPPPIPTHPYYGPPPHTLTNPSVIPHPHLTSSTLSQPLRYPLPSTVQPERIMSGGRHKKEIKRRTKTGCLTCRKRRIKCDEAHPTCKNCAKSKRECMGYDPIFKPQPGPAAIQPAPKSAVGNHNYAPSISTASNSPASSCEPYDCSSAIDPTLESAAPLPPRAFLGEAASTTYRPNLKRPLDPTSPLSCASDTSRASAPPIPRSITPSDLVPRDNVSIAHPAKRIKIDDLLSGGASSLPLTPPSTEQSMNPPNSTDEFKYKYKDCYAPMMDDLLETGWFETMGVARVFQGGQLVDALATLFPRLKARSESYVEKEDSALISVGGDAEILLNCIKLIYGTRPMAGDDRIHGRDDDYANATDIAKRDETAKRIAVLEALITVDLSSPQNSPRSSPRQYEGPHACSSSKFWTCLAKFVSLPSRGRERDIDEALEGMYANIYDKTYGNGDAMTNRKYSREILYNIARARHLYYKLCSPLMSRSEAAGKRRNLQAEFEKAKALVDGTARADMESYLPRICARAAQIWLQSVTQ